MTELDRNQMLRLVEALLFAVSEPLDERSIAARLPDGVDVRSLLAELAEQYGNRGVNLKQVGRSWAFRTAPDLAGLLQVETEVTRRLSRAAVETLAIIAYHQPVTRAEIEEIRGVGQSKGTFDLLLEAGWIRPGRRRNSPGRPLTWLTTEAFLDHFGLETVKELPGVEELKAAGFLDARPAVQAFRADDMDGDEAEDTESLADFGVGRPDPDEDAADDTEERGMEEGVPEEGAPRDGAPETARVVAIRGGRDGRGG